MERKNQNTINFLVDADRQRLSIYHHDEESVSDLKSYLVGPAMGIVMRLRGMVCMHSSAVAVDGKAIALPRHSTSGKSTTAAGLADAGAKIMADDIAVLNPSESGLKSGPVFSKVRLRPVAADFLTEDPDSLPIVYSNKDSRYVSLDQEKLLAAGRCRSPRSISSVTSARTTKNLLSSPSNQKTNF